MDDRARIRRDIAWNLVPVALLAGVGLGLNFAIGRWWSEDALGAFNQVTIAFFAFAVIGACGLQYATLRAIAEAPDDPARVAAVVVGALVPNVALAGVATAAFVALHRPIGNLLDSELVATGMLWAAPGLFCFAINKVLLGIVNGLRRMRAFAVYTSLRYILIAIGLVFARLLHFSEEQLPVVWTFVEGTLLLVLIGELVATVKLARCAGWTAWSRRHLDYGARGVTATLAYEATMKLDVWMLGVAMSDAQVGIYSMAAALYEGAMQLAVVVQNNLNPVLAHAIAERRIDDVDALVRRTRRWFVPTMIGLAALGAAIYPFAVPWLMGSHDYIGGAVPFAIMMCGVAFASPYLPFLQTLLMAHRPGWHTAYILGVLAVGFVANLALIGPLGLPGAATSAAAAVAASAVLLRLLVRRLVGARI